MNHVLLKQHETWRRLRLPTCLAIFVMCGLVNAATQSSMSHADVPDTIEQRVVACTSCHGPHGAGGPNARSGPRIAGQPAAYLALQLSYFQSGQRKNGVMQYFTEQLTPDYANEIAEYFANQVLADNSAKMPESKDQAAQRGPNIVLRGDPSRGVPPCASCHGSRLAGRKPLIPGLTGLSYEYISAQFTQWRSHTRAPDRPYCMGVVANRMTEAEIETAARWLANRQLSDVPATESTNETDPLLPEWCVLDQGGARW